MVNWLQVYTVCRLSKLRDTDTTMTDISVGHAATKQNRELPPKHKVFKDRQFTSDQFLSVGTQLAKVRLPGSCVIAGALP